MEAAFSFRTKEDIPAAQEGFNTAKNVTFFRLPVIAIFWLKRVLDF